jgi:putative spermidine/putrescine transport system permease protein
MRYPFQTRIILTLVLPALFFLTLFFLVPLAFLLTESGKSPEGGITLAGYVAFFQDSISLGIYWRTLKIALLATAICALIGYPASYAMYRMSDKARSILMSLVILPLMTNAVARTYAWLIILGRSGLINKLFLWTGLFDEPQRMIYTEGAIIVGLTQLFLPLMVLSLMSALENIPGDVIEAARSLGANGVIAFGRVVMPLSMDGFVLGSILVFTGCVTAYTTPFLLGGTRTLLLSTLLYQRALVLMDWNSATVIAMIMILTTLVVNLLLRQLRPKHI